MTAMMGQIGKQTSTISRSLVVLFVLGAGSAWADGLPPPFVVDPLTGVAIDGYDPVSYFTGPAPLAGRPDFEFDWGGVPWYFANPANRDVFMRAPQTYAPQFGGHGTTALAHGYLSDGNPLLYRITAQRLYLFYSGANRQEFDVDPPGVIGQATANWPQVARLMAPLPAPAKPPGNGAAAAPSATVGPGRTN